jgi:hypothetical protein
MPCIAVSFSVAKVSNPYQHATLIIDADPPRKLQKIRKTTDQSTPADTATRNP